MRRLFMGVQGSVEVECRRQVVSAIHLIDERGNQVTFTPSAEGVKRWAQAVWPSPLNRNITKIKEGVLLAEILMEPHKIRVSANNNLAGSLVVVLFDTYMAAELALALVHLDFGR